MAGDGPAEIGGDQNSNGEPVVEQPSLEEPYDPIMDPKRNSLMIMEANQIEHFHEQIANMGSTGPEYVEANVPRTSFLSNNQ